MGEGEEIWEWLVELKVLRQQEIYANQDNSHTSGDNAFFTIRSATDIHPPHGSSKGRRENDRSRGCFLSDA